MPGLSGLSNQSCERRFLPRGARVFGFLVMSILGGLGIWRRGCAEPRGTRKAVQKAEIKPKCRICRPGFRHGLVNAISCGPWCYIIRVAVFTHPLRAPMIERAT